MRQTARRAACARKERKGYNIFRNEKSFYGGQVRLWRKTMYIDWTYIILVLPAVLFTMWASANVKSTYNKYSRQQNSAA